MGLVVRRIRKDVRAGDGDRLVARPTAHGRNRPHRPGVLSRLEAHPALRVSVRASRPCTVTAAVYGAGLVPPPRSAARASRAVYVQVHPSALAIDMANTCLGPAGVMGDGVRLRNEEG